MIKIIKGERVDLDNEEGRIVYEYTVRLYGAIDIEYVVFKGTRDNNIIWPHLPHVTIRDHRLYEDLELMLTRRYERDTKDINK